MTNLEREGNMLGLELNEKKTKFMILEETKQRQIEKEYIKVHVKIEKQQKFERVKIFTYLDEDEHKIRIMKRNQKHEMLTWKRKNYD